MEKQAGTLAGQGFSPFLTVKLRKNGLVNTTVEGWAKWFAAHPDACNSEDLQTERQLRVQAQRDAAAKDKELARKDKALSETATMLVLAKKAQAIWGAKES